MLKKRSVFLFSIIFLFVNIFLYNYGLSLYASYWHAKYGDIITWGNFKIKIPKDFVVKEMEGNGIKDIQIYDINAPISCSIFFQNVTYHLQKKNDYRRKYEMVGYEVVDKIECTIAARPCVYIKSKKKGEEQFLREDIFFLSEEILISFIGITEKKTSLVRNTKKH